MLRTGFLISISKLHITIEETQVQRGEHIGQVTLPLGVLAQSLRSHHCTLPSTFLPGARLMLHLRWHIYNKSSDTKVKVLNGNNPPHWPALNGRLLGRQI